MRTRRWLAVAVAGGALVLTGCGGDDGDTTAAETSEATETEMATASETATGEASGTVTVATADTDLGTVLVDGEGRTLYLFDQDEEGQSNCSGGCADTWPPLSGTAEAGGDVDASLLGTTTRDDGSTQVTYDGHPLYYYAADSAPGDLNGQAVGEVWWVVAPDGSAIRETAAASGGPAY